MRHTVRRDAVRGEIGLNSLLWQRHALCVRIKRSMSFTCAAADGYMVMTRKIEVRRR